MIGTGFFISFILGLWMVGMFLGMPSDVWQMMEGLATTGTLAVAVGGGLVLVHQLSEAAHSRSLAEFGKAFDELTSGDQVEARRWIYNLPDDDEARRAAVYTPEGRIHVKLVLNSLDHLGFLVSHNWIVADDVVGWTSAIVVKVWDRIGLIVEEESHRRNEKDYYVHARQFAALCRDWRRRRLNENEWVSISLS